MKNMKQRLIVLLAALAVALGTALSVAPAAQAAPGTITIHTQCDSWSPVWTMFVYPSSGQTTQRNVNPCVYDGEVGGQVQEPYAVYVGPHWCITWWANGGTKNYFQGGANGTWNNIHPGTGYPYTWKVEVESWYGSWCP